MTNNKQEATAVNVSVRYRLTRSRWFRPTTDADKKELNHLYEEGLIVCRSIPGTEPREYEYRLPYEEE